MVVLGVMGAGLRRWEVLDNISIRFYWMGWWGRWGGVEEGAVRFCDSIARMNGVRHRIWVGRYLVLLFMMPWQGGCRW